MAPAWDFGGPTVPARLSMPTADVAPCTTLGEPITLISAFEPMLASSVTACGSAEISSGVRSLTEPAALIAPPGKASGGASAPMASMYTLRPPLYDDSP